MSVKNTLATVQGIKESLTKEIEKGDDELDEESCHDMLEQLDKCEISLQVLSASLIGTVVSKLKKHEALGSQAKGLVKKWKKVAKGETESGSGGAASAAASAKRRGSEASASSNNNNNNDNNAPSAADMIEEWADLPPHRQSICQKFHQFLGAHKKKLVKSGINAEAVDHLLVSRASEVEDATNKKFASDRGGYTQKARTLCFNLKKNADLAEQVILGQVPADELVNMSSEQLASAEAKREKEEAAKKLIDSKRLDWEQANEDKINQVGENKYIVFLLRDTSFWRM